jgi:hypothetical protein
MRCFSMLSAVSAALSRTVMGSRLFSLSLFFSLSLWAGSWCRQTASRLTSSRRALFPRRSARLCKHAFPPPATIRHSRTRAHTRGRGCAHTQNTVTWICWELSTLTSFSSCPGPAGRSPCSFLHTHFVCVCVCVGPGKPYTMGTKWQYPKSLSLWRHCIGPHEKKTAYKSY